MSKKFNEILLVEDNSAASERQRRLSSFDAELAQLRQEADSKRRYSP